MQLRWVLWSVVALVGVGAAAGLLALRPSSPAAAPSVDAEIAGPGATWPAGSRRSPEFHLTDQSGQPISLARFRGRPVLITFIDPLCRNYCPLEARRLGAVARTFPASERPAIVAVSVNTAGNGRANLVLDMRKWDVGSEWHWAVGGERQLASVWRRYDIGVLVQTRKVAGIEVRDVAHTEAAYVVDGTGHQRALFIWPYRAQDVVRTLRGLTPAAS